MMMILSAYHLFLFSLVLAICQSAEYTGTTYSNEYEGFECHKFSTLHNCHKLLPKVCANKNHGDCTMWIKGLLPSSEPSMKTLSTPRILDSCIVTPIPSSCASFEKGHFENGRWEKQGCEMNETSIFEFRKMLIGRSVIFRGNSLVRQLFLRLVWYLRGTENIIERYFHLNAAYITNGTHDSLMIDSLYDASTSGIMNPTFIAQYVWNDERFQSHEDSRVDLSVVGYSYYDSNSTDTIARMSTSNKTKTMLITMPKTHYNPEELKKVNDWIELNYAYHLPMSQLFMTHAFGRNRRDSLHFQCGFLAHIDENVTYAYKAPANGDCRDLMNLNMVFLVGKYLSSLPCRPTLY